MKRTITIKAPTLYSDEAWGTMTSEEQDRVCLSWHIANRLATATIRELRFVRGFLDTGEEETRRKEEKPA